jgi:hypothetical protein
MVEDAPATIEHGRRRRVMGTVRGIVSREVPIRGINSESVERVQCLVTGWFHGARVRGPFYGVYSICSAP